MSKAKFLLIQTVADRCCCCMRILFYSLHISYAICWFGGCCAKLNCVPFLLISFGTLYYGTGHSHSLFCCFVFIDCAVLLCCVVGYIVFCYNDHVYESLNQLPRSAFQRALTRLATLKFKFNFYLNIFNYDCMA